MTKRKDDIVTIDTIVVGILERGGKVSVNIVTDVKAESLMTKTKKKVRWGSIVYTDKWRGYDFLLFSLAPAS